jgi:hypothetical protein
MRKFNPTGDEEMSFEDIPDEYIEDSMAWSWEMAKWGIRSHTTDAPAFEESLVNGRKHQVAPDSLLQALEMQGILPRVARLVQDFNRLDPQKKKGS